MQRNLELAGLAVLALLSERPNHPYGLQAEIRERHIDFAQGKTRALYHAVERLQRDGLIEAVETQREGRRPERTVYRLTLRGRDELHASLMQLLARERDPISFRAALSMISHLPVEDALRSLESRKIDLECSIEVREGVDRVLRQRYELPRSVLLDHEFDAAACAAELSWLDGLIGDMRSRRVIWDPNAPPLAGSSPAAGDHTQRKQAPHDS